RKVAHSQGETPEQGDSPSRAKAPQEPDSRPGGVNESMARLLRNVQVKKDT
ncbi:hypothetical protein APX70_03980, partial [Pseudomonas syringae pv. maculicola]